MSFRSFHGTRTSCRISTGNSKIGAILNFSLPPQVTCPGASECKTYCYAMKAFRQYENVRNAWNANLSAVENCQEEWEQDMVEILEKKNPDIFRIHPSGDFFSVEYILAWIRIVRKFPTVKFLAFTKSWRIQGLSAALDILRDCKNVSLYASDAYDYRPEGYRVANMGPDGNAMLCKVQSGKAGTCKDCRICWIGRKDVYFKKH